MILYFVLQCHDAKNRPDLAETGKGNTRTEEICSPLITDL